jgi:hypothetical protein
MESVMKKFFYMILTLLLTSTIYANWQSAGTYLEGADSSAFGYSVRLNDKYAVVGAPYENTSAGAVYVFKKEDNGSWSQMQKLENPSVRLFIGEDPPYFESKGFGASVAIIKPAVIDAAVVFTNNKNIIAVGAPDSILHNTSSGDKNIGLVCMYELNDSLQWQQDQSCLYYNEGNFGVSIALSNYIVPVSTRSVRRPTTYELHVNMIVGNPKESDATYTNRGAVTLYDYNSSKYWNEVDHEISPQTMDDVAYGQSVAADKGWYIVGSPGYNSRDVDKLGTVYFYRASSNVLSLEEQILPAQTDNNNNWYFGMSVDIYNSLLIAGVRHLNGNINPGGAYIYWCGESCNHIATLRPSIINDDADSENMSVHINEKYVALGVPNAGVNTITHGHIAQGGVSVFNRENSSLIWTEKKIFGDSEHRFGFGVGLYENRLYLGDATHNKVTKFEDKTEINPAIIMYLLD